MEGRVLSVLQKRRIDVVDNSNEDVQRRYAALLDEFWKLHSASQDQAIQHAQQQHALQACIQELNTVADTLRSTVVTRASDQPHTARLLSALHALQTAALRSHTMQAEQARLEKLLQRTRADQASTDLYVDIKRLRIDNDNMLARIAEQEQALQRCQSKLRAEQQARYEEALQQAQQETDALRRVLAAKRAGMHQLQSVRLP